MSKAQTHKAKVLNVHDGDTVTVSVPFFASRRKAKDLGFHIYLDGKDLVLHLPIRLLGCNAIELKDPGGAEAQANLAALLPIGSMVVLSTVAADKYGTRYDASVQLPDKTDLVTRLVKEGWAAAWDGNGPKPTPAWPRVQLESTVTPPQT